MLIKIIRKIISLPTKKILTLSTEAAQKLYESINELEEYTDGMSPDRVRLVMLDAETCQLLNINPKKWYILKQSDENKFSQSRLNTEINERLKLENSPYNEIYVKVHAVYKSEDKRLPHLMVMDVAEGFSLSQMMLNPANPDYLIGVKIYLNRLCEAFKESKPKCISAGKERHDFLERVTFVKIHERIMKKIEENTELAKTFENIMEKPDVEFNGDVIPNPYKLFVSEESRRQYMSEIGISEEDAKCVWQLLESREVRMSPSDITPSNFKINLSTDEFGKPNPGVSFFCYDPGRFEYHSYSYSFCKLLGPFAEYFWFQIAPDSFEVDLENMDTLNFTQREGSKEAIHSYTDSIFRLLDDCEAHQSLVENRPFFDAQILFYSIRQLLADCPLREDKKRMAGDFICGAVLMKSLLLAISRLVKELKERYTEKESGKPEFYELIQDLSNYNEFRDMTKSYIRKLNLRVQDRSSRVSENTPVRDESLGGLVLKWPHYKNIEEA